MGSRRRRIAGSPHAAGLTLLLALFLGCESRPVPRGPNVLLISIDTLRADRLGCYGSPRDTSPNLDRLAEQSILFQNAFAPNSWTLASHVALLTGRHAYRLGITAQGSTIPREVPTLAEALHAAGYETAAFVDSIPRGYLGAERGFDRGFDRYDHAPHRPVDFYEHDTRATVDVTLEWLAKRDRDRPFFLFVHTKSVHAIRPDTPRPDHRIFPYDKREPYRLRFVRDDQASFDWNTPEGKGTLYLSAFNERVFAGETSPDEFPDNRLETLEGLYDAGISFTDEHLGRLLNAFSTSDLQEKTVIVVTSDHGEEFLEHGYFKHSRQVHRESLHVPLLIRPPGLETGRVIDEVASLMDVAPTILDLAGLPIPADMGGRILTRDAPGEAPPLELFSYAGTHNHAEAAAYGLRLMDWKLVYDRPRAASGYEARLYDLRRDPEERHPLEGEEERREAMLQRLLAWRDEVETDSGAEIELDAETTEQLRAIGYIR